jgi:hypothetical protein
MPTPDILGATVDLNNRLFTVVGVAPAQFHGTERFVSPDGHLHVSSLDQNEGRQLERPALDKTFTDKASGKNAKRPQLEAIQCFVREGDTVFCHSRDRLDRNLDVLRRTVLGLTERGIQSGRLRGRDVQAVYNVTDAVGAVFPYSTGLC